MAGACIGNVKEWNHQHVDCSCAGKCGQCCDFWDRILGCEITAEPVSYNSPGKTEDEQEQTKIGEKAKKLMEREDDIGLMMRSVHDSISSFATVISGIKTATEELKSVSDDFNNIFHDMEDSLKITQDSTHTIADNTVTQAAQTADMKEKIDAIGDLIAMISENVDALNASADKMQECNESAENIMGELIDISKKNGEAIENVREQSKLTNDSAQQIQTVTDIIADISNQTNLLALNASIEAARAGNTEEGLPLLQSRSVLWQISPENLRSVLTSL